MNAVTAITNDHRVLEKLFEQLKSGQGNRGALVAEVKARLTAHSVAEEEHVYPELLREEPGEADQVHHGIDEHREAEEKLATVQTVIDSDQFDMALIEFINAVSHHVEEEESKILPALKEAMSAAKLEELGQQFEQRRAQELKSAGIAA